MGLLLASLPYGKGVVAEQAGELTLTALDVGHGDAIVVSLPEGNESWWTAAGFPLRSFDVGERVVLPYLLDHGGRTLDAVVLTHADYDHIGGLTAIVDSMHVGEVWEGAGRWERPAYRRLRRGRSRPRRRGSKAPRGRELRLWRGPLGDSRGFRNAGNGSTRGRERPFARRAAHPRRVERSSDRRRRRRGRAGASVLRPRARVGRPQGGAPRKRELHERAVSRGGAPPFRHPVRARASVGRSRRRWFWTACARKESLTPAPITMERSRSPSMRKET